MKYIAIAIKYLLIGVGSLVGIGLFGWICWIWFHELLTPLLAMAIPAHGWLGWIWAVLLAVICLAIVIFALAGVAGGGLKKRKIGAKKERKEVKVKWPKKVLKWFIWLAVIFCLVILPFADKGIVVPDKWAGVSIGQAFGENIYNWLSFWFEFFSGLVKGITGQVNP